MSPRMLIAEGRDSGSITMTEKVTQEKEQYAAESGLDSDCEGDPDVSNHHSIPRD